MNNFYQRKLFFNPSFFFYDQMKTKRDVLHKSIRVGKPGYFFAQFLFSR
jgi:hypothetical protein